MAQEVGHGVAHPAAGAWAQEITDLGAPAAEPGTGVRVSHQQWVFSSAPLSSPSVSPERPAAPSSASPRSPLCTPVLSPSWRYNACRGGEGANALCEVQRARSQPARRDSERVFLGYYQNFETLFLFWLFLSPAQLPFR